MTDYSRSGAEFTVNTAVASNQSQPSVAGFAGGGFVVVWTTGDATQDGSGRAIKFQRYDGTGAAIGGEGLVNSVAALDQRAPSVTTLASGNFLVTWETSDTTQDGAGTAIKAQLFSGAGVAIGGEFRVNTQTAADQTNASVTGLSDGGFVVVWQTSDSTQDGTNNAIKAQRYDAAGAAVGGEFLVNPAWMGGEFTPHVTALASGGFLASWTLGNGTSADVYAQLFDAAGAKTGAAFRVNSVTELNQSGVTATQLADGRIVMTWTSSASLTTYDTDIKAQVFSATGERIGDELTVSTSKIHADFGTGLGPTDAQIDDLPDGGFVITWTQWGAGGDMRAQFYDASAQRVGGEVLVNSAANRTESDGDVAVDGLGGVLAVWGSSASTSPFDSNISGQLFTTAPGLAIESDGGGDTAAVSVVENTTAVTVVSASGGPGAVYAIVGGMDAARFTIDAATGALAFTSARNYEVRSDSNGNNIYQVTVSATRGSQFDVQQLTVTVTDANEAPSFSGSTTAHTYVENGTAAVATIQAADPEGGVVTYSLAGVDAAQFTISAAGVLGFVAPPDYEAPADAGGDRFYNVTVVASDGTLAASRALTIELRDQNEGPVITSNGGGATAALSVAESTDYVTTITTFDPDFAPTYQYTLSGADAARFEFVGRALYFYSPRNFEAPTDANGDGVYEVTISIGDGSSVSPPDTQALSITVTNVNERPTITSSSSMVVSEEQPAAGTVTAIDPEGDALGFAISGGADAARFTIDAATGALSFAATPDFEAPGDANGDNLYLVTVSASDGSLVHTQSLSVRVTNAAEAPVFTSAAALTASENATAVGTVTAADPEGSGVSYAIAGGADAALFTIGGATGVVAFVAAPDFEAPGDADGDNLYEVVVAASDGTSSSTQAVSIAVGNANEGLSITSPATASVAENGTVVATIGAADIDGDAVAFAITGGVDAGRFTIDAATGALGFVSAPDFEAPGDADGDNVYEVTVSASDGSVLDTQALSVAVTNTNEAPVVTSAAAVATSENGTAVTTVAATDPEGGVTYAIVGGTDGALFAIDAQSGALSFLAAPDFEAPADADGDNVYEVAVAASDGDLSGTQAISVSVGNRNEAVSITSASAFAVPENETAVAAITAEDLDGDAISYAIAGGADAARFVVDSATGTLSFASAPDFETPGDADGDNLYEVTVAASDGSLGDTRALSIAVGNVNDSAPVFAGVGGSLHLFRDENVPVVMDFAATDADGDPLTFSLAGWDATLFSIDQTTGLLQFVTPPDREAPRGGGDGGHIYSVDVTVSDGVHSDTVYLAITVDNVNEPVTITSSGGAETAAFTVSENTNLVTTIVAEDLDLTTPRYSISGGADAARFSIDLWTGELRFAPAPDFEAPADADGDNLYEVIVRAGDSGGLADTQALSVTVANVNEAPVITTPATLSASENATAVVTVVAADLEGGVTYAIAGGADAAWFAIDAASGALAFVSGPNFEAPGDADGNNRYEVLVSASDGALADTRLLSVVVGNVNEAPVITSGGGAAAAVYAINENATAVATIAAGDPDSLVTYALAGGADAARFAIDTYTGALRFLAAPDHDAPGDADGDNVYEVAVRAGDGSLDDTQTLAVSVGNVVDGLTLNGTPSGNTISGSYEEDAINGLGGNDSLSGLGAADTINGGDGQDRLIGGGGADLLTGGLRADDFIYTALGDSTLAASDRILDFSRSQGDDIDLSALDANMLVGGNQAFSFIGSAAFSGGAGQLRYFQQGGDTFVQGDVNGDRTADFQIVIDPLVSLVSGDFVL